MQDFTAYLDLQAITERYNTEEKAREFFENMRWPDGAICPHCGCKNAKRVGATYKTRKTAKRKNRPGLWYCLDCKDQFTVTEGTVMESSHIPLTKWLLAIYILGSSKKGVSAHQLHRTLGISYRAAWFMGHRIRYAMAREPFKSKLEGTIEVDETFIGGRVPYAIPGHWKKHKQVVVSLVQRGGESRSFHVEDTTAKTLADLINGNVPYKAKVYTDSWGGYTDVAVNHETHRTVNHYQGEYARGDVSTNTVEGFFSLLKRGILGIYHHVSEQHLPRYLAEFDYRYSRRKQDDSTRAIAAICATQGKRLTYRELPSGQKTEANRKQNEAPPAGGENP